MFRLKYSYDVLTHCFLPLSTIRERKLSRFLDTSTYSTSMALATTTKATQWILSWNDGWDTNPGSRWEACAMGLNWNENKTDKKLFYYFLYILENSKKWCLVPCTDQSSIRPGEVACRGSAWNYLLLTHECHKAGNSDNHQIHDFGFYIFEAKKKVYVYIKPFNENFFLRS